MPQGPMVMGKEDNIPLTPSAWYRAGSRCFLFFSEVLQVKGP